MGGGQRVGARKGNQHPPTESVQGKSKGKSKPKPLRKVSRAEHHKTSRRTQSFKKKKKQKHFCA